MNRGIDTDQERMQIEYRPRLEYIPPVVYIEEENGEQVRYQVPHELSEVSEVLVTDTWLAFEDVKERLERLIQECEQKMDSDFIKVDSPAVKQALRVINEPNGPFDQISFGDYRRFKLKPSRTSHEATIVDTYEKHHNELGGKLEVAILGVAYSLLDNVKQTLQFVTTDLMEELLSPDQNPDMARESELDKLNEWLRLDVRRQQLIRSYRDAIMQGSAQEELDRISKEYGDTEERIRELSIYGPRGRIGRKIYERSKKLNEVLDEWEWLTRSTVADQFDGYIVCMLRGLLGDIKTGFDLDRTIKRLRTIQAILEFVHGDHKLVLMDIRGKLSSLETLPQRLAAQAAGAALAVMKTHATDVIRSWLLKQDAYSDCPAFLELGRKLMQAAKALDIQFELLLDDEERSNRLEAAHYKELNAELREKRKTSDVFQILEELIKALETIKDWGEQEDLNNWIRKFVHDNNLDARYNPETGMVERISLDS